MIEKDEQLRKITSEYLTAFLGFAINKIGNITEAEELAQETVFQCIVAINKGNIKNDFDAYVWSIAHNVFKRWCGRKKSFSLDRAPDTFTNIARDVTVFDEQSVFEEEANAVRVALSRLADDYRKTIVCFYYEELSIRDIGQRLSLSEGMVKFYLRAGKQKLKEEFDMDKIGEKSFNPSEFLVYKSAIDFSKVNVWEVFKRKLPCQIALICHDNAKTISEISLETGTPAVYIEDEIQLLLDAGVMISPAKDKYRTNLFILKKNTAAQIKEQFIRLYDAYAPLVISAYEKYLPRLTECDVFKFDASDNQWAWFFAGNVSEFDYSGYSLSSEDYPQILSCGSKGFIFAEESKGSPWAMGHTPTELDKCTVWPCDVVIFSEFHRQKELRDERKAQALYDIYCGIYKKEDTEIYAELLQQGYVIKKNGVPYCNAAVSTKKSRKLFEEINAELGTELKRFCKGIRENIARIVKATIPGQLRPYTKGYTETWIMFYAGVYLHETLYNKGFLTVPADDGLTPVASYIYEKS